MTLNKTILKPFSKTFIIAEAGVNHNGDLELAKQMIDVAANTGADAVKFQTFNASKVVSKYAPKADYQKKSTDGNESQLEMVKKFELNAEAHKNLIDYSILKKIQFLSSPFDLESIELLCNFNLNIFKIPSGEITNLPYLRKIGGLNKIIVMSTGMSTLDEINDALDVLIQAGTSKEKITILHCNTEYPTPIKDVNLNSMLTIRDALQVKVGYSDHTTGIEVPIAAVALGATVIEKHFTLDRNMPGPDHSASLEPQEFKAMVQAIRNIEKALGDKIKKPTASELKNLPIVRKGIVADRDIRRGEVFSEENITTKRPGTGLSPMYWDQIIGKKAKKYYREDELI